MTQPVARRSGAPAVSHAMPASKAQIEEQAKEVTAMRALVVYESMFGNTAAIARAIVEGIVASMPNGCPAFSRL